MISYWLENKGTWDFNAVQSTYVGETAEAKAMDRSDSDSMLSVVAQDQKCLQNALAFAFIGRETPLVHVARDFDLQKQMASRWVVHVVARSDQPQPLLPCSARRDPP